MKRPLLDYYGGKWAVADRIIENFPVHKTFVDVFTGAGSITLKKPRSKNEIINDKHGEVVNLFHQVRENYYALGMKLKATPYARDEYKKAREPSDDPLEMARRTIIKAWFGIGDSLDNNSGFRVSVTQNGSCTAPWVAYTDYLQLYAERLRGVIIENHDYLKMIKKYDSDKTFFYLDPPYLRETRSKNHFYLHDWDKTQHVEMIGMLKTIKGKFLVSGYKSPLYDDAFEFSKSFPGRSQKKEAECVEVIYANYSLEGL